MVTIEGTNHFGFFDQPGGSAEDRESVSDRVPAHVGEQRFGGGRLLDWGQDCGGVRGIFDELRWAVDTDGGCDHGPGLMFEQDGKKRIGLSGAWCRGRNSNPHDLTVNRF